MVVSYTLCSELVLLRLARKAAVANGANSSGNLGESYSSLKKYGAWKEMILSSGFRVMTGSAAAILQNEG